jgi:pilus assembly protein Flp/PilA
MQPPASQVTADDQGRNDEGNTRNSLLTIYSMKGVHNMEQINTLIKAAKNGAANFASDEEGAQIVEYGLIIAVVSIALVIALSQIAGNGGPFGAFIARVTTCLTTATCA